eukprot:8547198-Heterocapsa_arctica.AAC.1
MASHSAEGSDSDSDSSGDGDRSFASSASSSESECGAQPKPVLGPTSPCCAGGRWRILRVGGACLLVMHMAAIALIGLQ